MTKILTTEPARVGRGKPAFEFFYLGTGMTSDHMKLARTSLHYDRYQDKYERQLDSNLFVSIDGDVLEYIMNREFKRKPGESEEEQGKRVKSLVANQQQNGLEIPMYIPKIYQAINSAMIKQLPRPKAKSKITEKDIQTATNKRIYIDIPTLIQAMGGNPNNKKERQVYRRELGHALRFYRKADLTITANVGGQRVPMEVDDFIGSFGYTDTKRETMFFYISRTTARLCLTKPIGRASANWLTIDNRAPNQLKIFSFIEKLHSINNNKKTPQTKGEYPRTNFSIVATLLKSTDLPRYSKLDKSERWRWRDRIKDPLERNLNKLCETGHLQWWAYGGKGGRTLTEEEQKKKYKNYTHWSTLRITFACVGDNLPKPKTPVKKKNTPRKDKKKP